MAGTTSSSKKSSKPSAALNQVRVTLREIDALLDFPDSFAPIQLIAGELRVPNWKIRRDQASISAVHTEQETRRQQQSERRAAAPVPPPPGVYCKVTGRLGDRWWRTFDRRKSIPIRSGKWVYVFQATSEHGDGARLVQELQFQDGDRFRRVDLARHRGKDERPVSSRDATTFLVDVERVAAQGVARAFHLFYLAPYQLPWAAVEALEAEPGGRTALLWDEFYTDAYQGEDPSSARPLIELEGEGGAPPADGSVSFVVHLPDPLKEALRRSDRYCRELDSLQQDEDRKRSNPVHQLALRLHLFTLGRAAAGLRENAPKLDPYLEESEHYAMLRLDWLDEVAFELVRWIFREEQRVPSAWVAPGRGTYSFSPGQGLEPVSVCYRKEPATPERFRAGYIPDPILFRRPARSGGGRRDAPWSSPFSQAANAYLGAEEEAIEQVSLVIAAALVRLLESAVGRDALAEIFGVLEGNKKTLADGGSLLLFGGGDEVTGAAQGGNPDARKSGFKPGSKAAKTVSTGTGVALAVYGKFFAERYKREALSEFWKFVEARWGRRTLREVEALTHPEYLHTEKLKYKEARQALRGRPGKVRAKLRKLELDPGWAQDLKVLGEAAKFVDLGVKFVSTLDLVAKVAHAPEDGWAWADLGSQLATDYKDANTFIKALPKIPTPEIYKSVATGAVKLNPLSLVTSVYDVVKGVRDIDRAKDEGERTGAVIAEAGSIAALAGVLTAEVSVALPVIGLIAIGLQLAGKWYTDNFNDAALFVRNSRFGEPGGAAGWGDQVRYATCDKYWYRGPLGALAADLPAQHRALTELMFNFTPQLTLSSGRDATEVGVEIVPTYPSQLAQIARWELEASFVRDDGSASQIPLGPAVLLDGSHTKSRFTPLFTLEATSVAAPGWRPPTMLGVVRGKIVLHPFGDTGPSITREFAAHTSELFRDQARSRASGF
jgi:hypothetical protein